MKKTSIVAVCVIEIFYFVFSVAGRPIHSQMVEFTVITTKGWVRYAVGASWTVLWMEPKPPRTTAGYQIPNRADQSTSDSSNFALITVQKEFPEAVASEMVKAATQWGASPPLRTKHDGWTVFSQEAKQKDTDYTVRNAYKDIADVRVFVRFAWPHLKTNPQNYPAEMDGLFDILLDSIVGKVGKYEPRKGEVFRRKEG